MATNSRFGPNHETRKEQAGVAADFDDDLLAGHLAEALAQTEDPDARYHLREALQLRITEQY